MADDHALRTRCWSLLETLHVVAYFAPRPAEEYAALGLTGGSGYFASRSAPMGPVPAEVITATFYNFSPDLVALSMDGVWQQASPEQVLAARHRGTAEALHTVLPDVDGPAAQAAELVRALTADLPVAGRPLFAAHAALPWPEDPLLAVWHAGALLREFRGDGHVAVLVANDIAPIDACIHGGIHAGLLRFNRKTRGWTEEQWSAALERLTADGLVTVGEDGEPALTAEGDALRVRLEEQTEAAADYGWDAVGTDGLRRIDELLGPLARTVRASGVLPGSVQRSKDR